MRTLYFISDLHIGGDEALGVCDFEDELVEFLYGLEARDDEDVELVIIGDAFGLWEFTQIEGKDKLDALIAQFPRIFEAFRRAGETIRITLLPGNHDYELACYPEFVDALGAYNVHLEQTESITRELGDARIRIEHGNQHDVANRMPDYGNPYAQPFGYFVTSKVVGSAGQLSRRGRYNWLKDVQSVYPTEDVPQWVLSNYFYREMSPFLRWLLLPFLLLFGVTLFVLAGSALEALEITDGNVFLNNRFFDSLGIVGSLFQLVLTINAVVLTQLLVLAVPLFLIVRDAQRTAKRFGIQVEPGSLAVQKEDRYIDAAKRVFEADPAVVVFIYGHTHAPSVRRVGERAVVNTGTWLKRLEAVAPRFGTLPPIYVPSFCLNFFRIQRVEGEIVIDYEKIDKPPERELTLVQRLLAWRRGRTSSEPIPKRTVLSLGA